MHWDFEAGETWPHQTKSKLSCTLKNKPVKIKGTYLQIRIWSKRFRNGLWLECGEEEGSQLLVCQDHIENVLKLGPFSKYLGLSAQSGNDRSTLVPTMPWSRGRGRVTCKYNYACLDRHVFESLQKGTDWEHSSLALLCQNIAVNVDLTYCTFLGDTGRFS